MARVRHLGSCRAGRRETRQDRLTGRVAPSGDVGRVVFAMVEQGILIKQDGDQPKDFVDVFDFEEAFELNYPWEARP